LPSSHMPPLYWPSLKIVASTARRSSALALRRAPLLYIGHPLEPEPPPLASSALALPSNSSLHHVCLLTLVLIETLASTCAPPLH